MFVINLRYVAPLADLDAQMANHVKFLQKQYKENTFIASGRLVPRTGGIILARGKSKEAIEALMRTDPFVHQGLAEVTVTEFLTSQMHPAFRAMMELLDEGK
jgi:uncharacterized protein YciI